MTTEQIMAIKKRKGASFPLDFIEQFDREWDTVVGSVKKSGADLSKILLTEEPVSNSHR